jgi:hypothetical protein
MDVLSALDVNPHEINGVRSIYMNPLLFNKMHDHTWHNIMINTRTMRVIGIIYNVKAAVRRLVSDCLDKVDDVVGIVMGYAREYYFKANDASALRCGVYKLYTMNRRVVYQSPVAAKK